MKRSVIEEIYSNSESLSEQVALNKKYKRISEEACGFYKQFVKVLNVEQKKAFDDFINSELDVCAEREFLYFKEGVKIGLLLATECLM